MTSQLSLTFETTVALKWLATVSPRAFEPVCYAVVWPGGRAVFVAPSPSAEGLAEASERATEFGRRHCGVKYRVEEDGAVTELARYSRWDARHWTARSGSR